MIATLVVSSAESGRRQGNASRLIYEVKSVITPYAHLRLRGQDDHLSEVYLFSSHVRGSRRVRSGPVVAPTIQGVPLPPMVSQVSATLHGCGYRTPSPMPLMVSLPPSRHRVHPCARRFPRCTSASASWAPSELVPMPRPLRKYGKNHYKQAWQCCSVYAV